MSEIITRKDALALGLKHYFTGKPCKRGHADMRWACSAKCFSCHYEDNPIKGFYGKSEDHKKSLSKERAKKWYEKNKSLTIKRATTWKYDNPERARVLSLSGMRKFRSTPEGKCLCFMRDSLRRCMKNKNDRTSNVLGYKKDDLLRHLERQFSHGMSWGNHGEWHIDHIVPVSWHLKNGETNPRVINALTNLRPIWASENNSKGSKRDFLL